MNDNRDIRSGLRSRQIIIPRDPTVALVRPKAMTRNERRPLTADATQRILHVGQNYSGSLLAMFNYTVVRRGEAPRLKCGAFDFKEDRFHIQRDIDYAVLTAQEGALKIEAADRHIPIPPELKEMLLKQKWSASEYVFHTETGKPLSQATFKRLWCHLMLDAGWVQKPDTSRENDILKCIKPIITLHCFRNNYITLLYETDVDPLIAMKIAGHSDYRTTASVYTHIRDEMLKKSTVNIGEDFRKREEEYQYLRKRSKAHRTLLLEGKPNIQAFSYFCRNGGIQQWKNRERQEKT